MADDDAVPNEQVKLLLAKLGWKEDEIARILGGPTDAPDELVLSWTKASVVLADTPDPYNAAAINAILRDRRLHTDSDVAKVQSTLETTMSLAMATTGYGAIVGVVFELLKWVLNEIIPLSEGGWDKLPVLVRQRITLFQLHYAFEGTRNKRIYPSQLLDLSNGSGQPDTTYGGFSTPPVAIGSSEYRAWIRNRLIRIAYAAEFKRVTLTADEPCPPAIIINLLRKNSLWPPPLPPIPISREDFAKQWPDSNQMRFYYYDLGSYDQTVLKEVYAELWSQYLIDAAVFRKVVQILRLPDDLRQLAQDSGCIPEPFSPASPLYNGSG